MNNEAGRKGYAVVDLETSGLNPDTDHILEIAVVLLDPNGRPEREWSTRVRQPIGRKIGAKHIHGLSWWSLRRGIELSVALRTVADLVNGRIMVAHNADFDTAFLRNAASRHGVDLEFEGPLCTLKMSRANRSLQSSGMASSRTSHKLAAVCERYEVPFVAVHQALGDARACATVLPLLLRDLQMSHGQEFLAGS